MITPHFSPSSHSFNEGVACVTKSVIAAIVFNHLFFWLKNNKSKGMHQHEGRTWMYEKIADLAVHFPYLSEQQIKDGLALLVRHNYIFKGNFSKNKFDHTNWYSVTNEDWLGIQKSFTKRSTDPIGKVHRPDPQGLQTRSYTDNNTDNETHINLAQTPAAPRQKSSDISFSFDDFKFEHITDQDYTDWKEIYPLVDIQAQLKEMIQWIRSNPSKANTRQLWRKFVTSWLKKEQVKLYNQEAYRQSKSTNSKNDILARHKGFQKDTRPVHPSRTLDFSNLTEETECT